jgi:hypothetical protein
MYMDNVNISGMGNVVKIRKGPNNNDWINISGMNSQSIIHVSKPIDINLSGMDNKVYISPGVVFNGIGYCNQTKKSQ